MRLPTSTFGSISKASWSRPNAITILSAPVPTKLAGSCSVTGCMEAGGEVGVGSGQLDTTQKTGAFDLYLQAKSLGGVWYYWPSHTYEIDQPCGPFTQGDRYPYSVYEWSWNKP